MASKEAKSYEDQLYLDSMEENEELNEIEMPAIEKRTRQEHVEWSKERALQYLDRGEIGPAYQSMVSDLMDFEETKNHIAIKIGLQLMMMGQLSTCEEMRKFIVGFH